MTDQILKKDLLNKLSRFLDDQKDGNGSYAPVTKEEITELYNMFYEVLSLKYLEDCDGDLPIQLKIIDKTKYQSLKFFPVPHLGLNAKLEEVEEYLSFAHTNLSMATEQIRIASIHLKFVTEDQQKGKK